MLKILRCGSCNRMLAKTSSASVIEIKCPRCGTLNHQKAMSLQTCAPLSANCGGHHGKTSETTTGSERV
ncbi:MAG: Com family DNA-binding transcriptional regulator [Gammaproteobacteria bacterium HGW-Gammaproteobacteria-11]|nr:MAG: Com family DNA-binding transcriptional regulator [Gammaproteobacteria bacterium HGW-Gammaproteobacteria-11]